MPTHSVSQSTPIRRSAPQAAFLDLLPDRPCQSLGRRGGSIEVCQVVAAPVYLPDLGQWVAGAHGQALLRPHAGPRSIPSPTPGLCATNVTRLPLLQVLCLRQHRIYVARRCLPVKNQPCLLFVSVRMATDGDSSSPFAGCIAISFLCSLLYHH